MTIPELDELLKTDRTRIARRKKSRKLVATAMHNTVRAVYDAFEANAEFRDHLLKAFDSAGRVFVDDDGAKIFIERMFNCDLPMAIGEIAPYDQRYDEDRERYAKEKRQNQVLTIIRERLEKDVLKLKLRNSIDWTSLHQDLEVEASRVLEELGDKTLSSYASYSMAEDKTGRLTLLTPYFNPYRGILKDQSPTGCRLNAMLGIALHQVMNLRCLDNLSNDSKRTFRKFSLPKEMRFTSQDSWAGRHARFDLDLGNMETLYTWVNGNDDGNEDHKKMFYKLALRNFYRHFRNRINEKVTDAMSFAGLTHQIQIVPQDYLHYVAAELK